MFKPSAIIFFALSRVMATLLSILIFSLIDPTVTLKFYNRVIANIARGNITATVPNSTNLVKPFQVFL